MEEITTNAKIVTLDGTEMHVHFSSAFPYFWVRNDGTGAVLMSISPNISEGKDGVIEVIAGSSAGTMHGYNATSNDLYLLGSGKVQIMGTYTPENPFKQARKGGEKPIDDFDMTGIEARFEASEEYIDETNGHWLNMVKGGNDFKWNNVSLKPVHMTDNNGVVVTDPYYTYCRYTANSSKLLKVIYAVIKKPDKENDCCILGRGYYYSTAGYHIGLFSEQNNEAFSWWASGSTTIKIDVDVNKWHLFTIVCDFDNSNTAFCFCDGAYYGPLRNVFAFDSNVDITLGYLIYGSTTARYPCDYPIYLKFIAMGDLPIKNDKTLNYMDTVYNNMDWIMQNIVNPANEEG